MPTRGHRRHKPIQVVSDALGGGWSEACMREGRQTKRPRKAGG
ncbi:hypothetical protein V6Z11_D08G244000 [Gossypium hirsutum]